MKQNIIPKNKKLILLSTLAIAVVAVVGGFIVYNGFNNTSAETKDTVQRPAFTFDTSKAPSWWSGGSYHAKDDTEGYVGDVNSLPDASMTIAQGSQEAPGTCFVNFFYYKGSIDAEVALSEKKNSPLANDKELTLIELSPIALRIDTFEGIKDYTLYQSTLEGSLSNNITRGQEFAYIQLSKGYIELQGYCETGDQITNTLTAINAVGIKL